MRRSTRIRHGSVNPDGSSPESVTSSTSSQVTRTTRRRAAENAAATVEPLRSTRTRKNSNPSTIVEQPEFETASDMPSKGRTSKQNSVNNSPETPKPITTRTRSVLIQGNFFFYYVLNLSFVLFFVFYLMIFRFSDARLELLRKRNHRRRRRYLVLLGERELPRSNRSLSNV